MNHAMKVLVHKMVTKKEETTADPDYERAEAVFLNHFHTSIELMTSLDSYFQALHRMGSASGDVGQQVSSFYKAADGKEPAGVGAFQHSMTTLEHTTKTLATKELQDQVLTEWTEYCGFLQTLYNKIAERKQLKEEFDYYKKKVRELKEKPARDETSLPRNESKLYNAETAYDTLNQEMIDVFKSVSLDAPNAFNPLLQKVLACTATVHSESARLTGSFHDIVSDPASHGCEVKDAKYKPLKLHYGISPIDPSKLKKVVIKPVVPATTFSGTSSSSSSSAANREYGGPATTTASAPKQHQETADLASFINFEPVNSTPVAATPAAAAPTNAKVKRARGLFDFEATNEDELSFRTGDVLVIIDETEEGWWTAEKDGKRGVIPNNYVEVI